MVPVAVVVAALAVAVARAEGAVEVVVVRDVVVVGRVVVEETDAFRTAGVAAVDDFVGAVTVDGRVELVAGAGRVVVALTGPGGTRERSVMIVSDLCANERCDGAE